VAGAGNRLGHHPDGGSPHLRRPGKSTHKISSAVKQGDAQGMSTPSFRDTISTRTGLDRPAPSRPGSPALGRGQGNLGAPRTGLGASRTGLGRTAGSLGAGGSSSLGAGAGRLA